MGDDEADQGIPVAAGQSAQNAPTHYGGMVPYVPPPLDPNAAPVGLNNKAGSSASRHSKSMLHASASQKQREQQREKKKQLTELRKLQAQEALKDVPRGDVPANSQAEAYVSLSPVPGLGSLASGEQDAGAVAGERRTRITGDLVQVSPFLSDSDGGPSSLYDASYLPTSGGGTLEPDSRNDMLLYSESDSAWEVAAQEAAPGRPSAEGGMEVTVAADGGVAAPSAEEADAEGFLQSSSARDGSDELERKLSGSSAKTPAKTPGENEDENMTGGALSSFLALLRDAREEVYREVGYGSLLQTQTGTTTSMSNGKQLSPCTIALVVVASVLLLLLFAVLVVYCIFTKNGGPKSRGGRAADAEERSPLLKATNKRSASSRGSGREEGQGSTGSGTFSGEGRTQTPIATGCPPVEAAPSK
eukprot:g10693.t1